MESTKDLEKYTYDLLAERGVTLEDIAELVLYVQKPYMPNLKIEECREHVASVLSKREVHNAIITGIELDKLTEQNKLSQPLQRIVANDEASMASMKSWPFPSLICMVLLALRTMGI